MMITLLIGLVAGILSGLFGIGGGVVIVPALLLLTHFSPEKATGTSLAALLLPVGGLGAWHYYRLGLVDVFAAAALAAGLFVGAFLGAHLATRLPAVYLQKSLALFLIFVAWQLWRTA